MPLVLDRPIVADTEVGVLALARELVAAGAGLAAALCSASDRDVVNENCLAVLCAEVGQLLCVLASEVVEDLGFTEVD